MSILEAFLSGKEARRVADAAEQINAMQSFIGQNGQAIMAGDQNALGQLAGYGVAGMNMAMGVQDNLDVRQDRAYNRDRAKVEDGRADEKWRLEVEEYKKGLTAEQAAQEAAVYENAAKMALTATSPEQWDQLATENGAPELVGQFDNRQAVAARFMTTAEILKSTQPPSEADALDLERKRLEIEALRNPAVKPPETKVVKMPDGSEVMVQWDAQTQTWAPAPLPQGGTTGTGDGVRTGKPTEGSLASEGYLQRMKGAEEIFTELEKAGTTALGYTDRPAVDTDLEGWKLTEPEQRLLQAQRDWVRAKLRKESGAVIGPEEMASEIKQYFPQPGEGPKTAAQKKEARKRAEEQLRITAMLPETSLADDGTGIGTIEDGFRYIGGDASTPEAWEPVQ